MRRFAASTTVPPSPLLMPRSRQYFVFNLWFLRRFAASTTVPPSPLLMPPYHQYFVCLNHDFLRRFAASTTVPPPSPLLMPPPGKKLRMEVTNGNDTIVMVPVGQFIF